MNTARWKTKNRGKLKPEKPSKNMEATSDLKFANAHLFMALSNSGATLNDR